MPTLDGEKYTYDEKGYKKYFKDLKKKRKKRKKKKEGSDFGGNGRY
tara:strand:+ start:136 stop:273 length:138 start_codon:yes stop_codon:yes gene_type:complete